MSASTQKRGRVDGKVDCPEGIAEVQASEPTYNPSCISYGILSALIARIFIHPVGALEQTSTFIRIFVAVLTIVVLFLSKKNVLLSSFFGIILFGILNFYIH